LSIHGNTLSHLSNKNKYLRALCQNFHRSLPLTQHTEAPPKYIEAQLGHSSIQTTFDRYEHLIPQIHQAEARKLDRLVFARGSVLGEVEPVMPHGSSEADAVQRSQDVTETTKGVQSSRRLTRSRRWAVSGRFGPFRAVSGRFGPFRSRYFIVTS
jgi:hypothetical protein